MIHSSESVAGLIEAYLKKTGKTQVQLEAETGITDTHIARLRSGTLPGKWTIPPLARVLGLSAKALSALVARERDSLAVGKGGTDGHGRSSCLKGKRTPARSIGQVAK